MKALICCMMARSKSGLSSVCCTCRNVCVVRLSCAELQAQSCVTADGDPFTTICTPAKGMAAAPAPPQNSFSPASSAMTTSNKRYDSHQVVWLTEPKAAIIPLNPKIQLASIKQLTDSIASLVVSVHILQPCLPEGIVYRALQSFHAGAFSNHTILLEL